MRAFASSLPMALLSARESVMRRFRPSLRRHSVTEQQWRVLRALAGHRGIELAELAARTCLLPPSLSRILPDLERRGLVARAPVAADMRRSSASLTAEGVRLIAAHAPESEAIYRAIEDRFGPERLRYLLGLLRELEEAAAPPTRAVQAIARRAPRSTGANDRSAR
ncbi:MAG TPA: homoprotocatechuate degradation operon regulator HpaR [Steroidobacteraceae bacterium]|nr:homoprotocatechuate degradation operon regulator HpaR [Steroidobacteraceae bacterium]